MQNFEILSVIKEESENANRASKSIGFFKEYIEDNDTFKAELFKQVAELKIDKANILEV